MHPAPPLPPSRTALIRLSFPNMILTPPTPLPTPINFAKNSKGLKFGMEKQTRWSLGVSQSKVVMTNQALIIGNKICGKNITTYISNSLNIKSFPENSFIGDVS